MVFKGSTPWLHVRDFLLSWKEGDSFDSLSQCLGNDWQAQVATVARHIPADTESLEDYWTDLFNSYQTQFYQDKEVLSLKKDLMQVPGTWERLKNLTSF
jgi:hypothetical protein